MAKKKRLSVKEYKDLMLYFEMLKKILKKSSLCYPEYAKLEKIEPYNESVIYQGYIDLIPSSPYPTIYEFTCPIKWFIILAKSKKEYSINLFDSEKERKSFLNKHFQKGKP